jgi:small conductance mechanosensitive channel
MENVMSNLVEFATTYGIKVIGALLIIIIGRIVAGILRSVVMKAFARADMDDNLAKFFGRIVYTIVIIFAVMASLAKFGVETTSFVAILGAAGFAIGFALQGSLSNFASGVMLLVFRPFKTGDFIDAGGVSGTVFEIQLFNTTLDTPDNVRIIVPNGGIYGGTIKNFSHHDTRRADLSVGIGYGEDIGKAASALEAEVKADSRVLADPAPAVAVTELADSCVNLRVRYWVKAEDYWPSQGDLTRRIKERLDKEGVEIPFPQQVVYMNNADQA